MATPKILRRLGMGNPSAADNAALALNPPAVPQDPAAIAAAVLQLQNTLNELIKHFNAHQHAALNAAPSTDLHTGAGATAQNLFTTT